MVEFQMSEIKTQEDYVPSDDMHPIAASNDRLAQVFESSARRWELIVYPSLFAFIILAAYGFYLIFNLAKDVHYLAISVDTNMTVLASNMQSVSDNMGQLSANVRTMAVSVESMNQKVGTLEPMLANITSMEKSLNSMTYATHHIGRDFTYLNHNVARPMSFMNTFMPW
jgi:uncharacterized protein YoxC